MRNNNGLITAYIFDGEGGGRRVGWKEIQEWTPSDTLLWVHLNYTAPEAQRWIKEESQLEDVVGNALLAEESRPRVTAFDDGLLISLRGVKSQPWSRSGGYGFTAHLGAEKPDYYHPQKKAAFSNRSLQCIREG